MNDARPGAGRINDARLGSGDPPKDGRMKLVVGLAGSMGSGKTLACDHLKKTCSASQYRFSQVLMDLLARLHMPNTRENLQILGASLRREFGADVIINALKHDLEKDSSKIMTIDGVRFVNEVEMIKQFPHSLVIFLEAPVEVRYGRCVARGEKGEGTITFEQFLESEKKETEKHTAEIKAIADKVIDNSGTKEELYRKIDKIIKEKLDEA